MKHHNRMYLMIFVVCVSLLHAEPEAGRPTGRILHFPTDRSLGKLMVLDANVKRQIKKFAHWLDGGWIDAEYLCEAQGEVVIPAGKQVSLTVSKNVVHDLSPLLNLRPDDLHRLSLGSHPARNSCMQYITHLTGLKELDLARTHITSTGLKLVTKLKSLECLTPPGSITDAGLRYVTGLTPLKRLYLDDSNVTDKGLVTLSKLSGLEELSLTGKSIRGPGLVHLTKLPSLYYLMLGHLSFGDTGMAHIRNIPSLKILSFRDASIGDAGVQQLSGHEGLENVSFVRAWVTDHGLGYLKTMPSLKKLVLYGVSKVTDMGMAHLAQISSLEYLDLPGISDTGVVSIAKLTGLKHLHIYGSSSSTNTDTSLKHLSKLQSLESLMVPGNNYTNAGMGDLGKLTRLRTLILSADSVTNEGLAELKALKSLGNLTFGSKHVTLSGLSSLNALENLSVLNLSGIRQDNSGMDISGLAKLEELILGLKKPQKRGGSYDCARDEDLACLKDLKNLKCLKIQVPARLSKITDFGVSHLKDLTHMERLSIHSAHLTDASLSYLTNMTKLYDLNITGNFTDNGLRHLEGLKGLQYVRITSSENISPTALKQLQNSLPNIYILDVKQNKLLR